jgi:hypothetical protein
MTTSFDGDWDAYIDDFVTKIHDYLDIIDSAWDGWPGIRHPVAEIHRLKRIGKAVDEFLDKVSS